MKNYSNISIKQNIIAIVFCLSNFIVFAQDVNYFNAANALFKKQQWDKAKVFIDKGLKESPKDSDLLMLNGKYYHMKGNNERARYYLMKSIQIDPKNTESKEILINVEMQKKNYSAAICYVNEILEVQPYAKNLWRKKIELYNLQGNTEEANRLIKRINHIYPEDAKLKADYKYNLTAKIKKLKKSGNFTEAIKQLDELIALDGNNPELYSEIIRAHISNGNNTAALAYTNKAIGLFPNQSFFLKRKASLLNDIGDRGTALEFLNSNQNKNADIKQIYNETLLENARFQNQNDPYTLYGKIFEKKPGNTEAFNYLLNTSLTRGYYTDAQDFIDRAKKSSGETKDLLNKEYRLNKILNNKSKENQILEKMYRLFPSDTEIQENYLAYQFQNAKQLVENQQYVESLVPLNYLRKLNQKEYTENVLQMLVTVYTKLQRNDEALQVASNLIASYPENLNNYQKKASIYLTSEKYEEALEMYQMLIDKTDSNTKLLYLSSFEEISLQYVKKLIDAGQTAKALEIIKSVLEANPKNDLALRYAINNSFKMENYVAAMDYAKQANTALPDNIYFTAKLAEAHYHLKKYKKANEIVSLLLKKYSYNQDLININTQIAIDSSKILFKNKSADEMINLTTTALKYNKNDKELKYYKGLGFEMKKVYDSAYYYQDFYEPSAQELSGHKHRMLNLKNRSYKNQISFFHLQSRFSDQIAANGISTIEYTKFYNPKNTFIGRLNYTGRDLGAGYMVQAEWNRVLNKKTYANFDAAYGTQYFPQIVLNANFYRSIANETEIQLGLGYRNLPNIFSLYNGTIGVAKYWDSMWLSAKGNVYSGTGTFYNILLDSKFYLFDQRKSYFQAMTSVGSIPEAGALDLALYSKFNAFNTMVGLGLQHIITDKITLGLLGNWYNFKDNATEYRNLYNLYFQVNYSL